MNENITKIEAARRQWESAAEIYFSGGDLLSSWTLAAAAYNVTRDLSRAQGLPQMMIKEQLPRSLPIDRGKALIKSIQETENFCKHADRDPNAVLEFKPNGRIELLLFDSGNRLRELTGNESPLMALFRMWFLSNAQIEHQAGQQFEDWLESIKAKDGESPTKYRDRMWDYAKREATKDGEKDKDSGHK